MPGSVWWLRAAPPWAWVLAAWGVAGLVLWRAGRDARSALDGPGSRRTARAWWWGLAAAGVAVVGMLALLQTDSPGSRLRGEPRRVGSPAAQLSAVAVRDGSCFVLQCGGKTLVFDCALGVSRIDVLVISHADLDHYNGVPDLLDAMPVDAVWVSPDVPAEAAHAPGRAAAVLASALRARGLTPRTLTRGDRFMLGPAELEVLWPPPLGEGGAEWLGNDGSVVLRASVAGRRLLLSGDIQERATDVLLQDPAALRADVADLPHHGGLVELCTKNANRLTERRLRPQAQPQNARRPPPEDPPSSWA